jgi:type III secretion protein V
VISTAAGILVTRVSSEEADGHLGGDIGRQLLGQPKALAVAASLLAVLAVIPGLPAVPFLVLAALLGLLAWKLLDARPAEKRLGADVLPTQPLLVPIEIELSPALGRELLPVRGPARLRDEWLPAVRQRLFAELGIPVPPIELRVAASIENGYTIKLHEIPVASATIEAGASGAQPSPGEVIASHLHRVLCQHGYRLVGIQETQSLLDNLERTHPALVREVVPKLVTPVFLADVLQRLAKEGVSLRSLADILSALAKRGGDPGDAAAAAERVRSALQRQLTFQHGSPDGSVGVYFLDSMIEETVREGIRKGEAGDHLALPPELAHDIVAAVERAVAGQDRPVILTSPDVRRHLRGLLEHEQPKVTVLAYQELLPEAKLETRGQIAI